MALQVGARCTLEITFYMYKVSLKCAYECVRSVKNCVQTVHHMVYIYKVSLQCVSSAHCYLQTGHRMFYICRVSLQCGYKCVSSDYFALGTACFTLNCMMCVSTV